MSRSMAAAASHRSGYAGREGPLQDSRDRSRWDDLDAILNEEDDRVERETSPSAPAAPQQSQRSTWRGSRNTEGDALGIDEEIKVRKARAPTAKLDEERLLSAKGIPKLRKITKTRLKFKGKGHEFSDVARMLNVYQLWLDDMFPKANFADGLSMIEKLGHKKRIQIMRREWIDEDKPSNNLADEDLAERDAARLEAVVQENAVQNAAAAAVAASPSPPNADGQEPGHSSPPTAETGEQEPDEDELDALLAEIPSAHQPSSKSLPVPVQDALSDEDMDALEAMGNDW